MKESNVKEGRLKNYYFYQNTWKPTILFSKTISEIISMKMKILTVQIEIPYSMMHPSFFLKEKTSHLIFTNIIEFESPSRELLNPNFAGFVLEAFSICIKLNEYEKKGIEIYVCIADFQFSIFFYLQLILKIKYTISVTLSNYFWKMVGYL